MKTTKDFLIAKKRSAPAPIDVPAGQTNVPIHTKDSPDRFYVFKEHSGTTANKTLYKQVTRGNYSFAQAKAQAQIMRDMDARKTRKSRQKKYFVMQIFEV